VSSQAHDRKLNDGRVREPKSLEVGVQISRGQKQRKWIALHIVFDTGRYGIGGKRKYLADPIYVPYRKIQIDDGAVAPADDVQLGTFALRRKSGAQTMAAKDVRFSTDARDRHDAPTTLIASGYTTPYSCGYQSAVSSDMRAEPRCLVSALPPRRRPRTAGNRP
jgi:hypothetical protein